MRLLRWGTVCRKSNKRWKKVQLPQACSVSTRKPTVYGLAASLARPRPARPEESGNDDDPTHFKHGSQFYATKHALLHEHSSLLHQLTRDQQALLRFQSGTGADSWVLAIPSCDWVTLPGNLFLLALRRRLFLPVSFAAANCGFYGKLADQWGHHCLACTRSGWRKRRATGLGKAWVQVLAEANATAHHRPLPRDLAIAGVMDTDFRQLDIIAGGLSLNAGRTVVGDAMLRSPLSGAGIAHGAMATVDGATFPAARRNEADALSELVAESARHKFLVSASEVGGRFPEECVELVKKLLHAKFGHSQGQGRKLLKLICHRRWGDLCLWRHKGAVASNLLGGNWAPTCEFVLPCEEKLLRAVVVPPESTQMR